MIRSFQPDPLDPKAVDHLLDMARRAPSAGHTQATGFVLLDQPETVAAYWDVTLPEPGRSNFRWQGLLEAPVLILITVEPDAYPARYLETDKAGTGRGEGLHRWPVPYWWVDAGAVAQNLLLLATEAGLGACLFGPFDHEPALARQFALPDGVRIAATVSLGRPAPDEPGRSAGRGWKPLEQIRRRIDPGPASPPYA